MNLATTYFPSLSNYIRVGNEKKTKQANVFAAFFFPNKNNNKNMFPSLMQGVFQRGTRK